ncbi:CD209 antigen-like protein E [Xyrichtys novacula]|uniref:CD209 antigen-like protein E n=1 Tax=Xyrichtys novacula TaxID=13765 RepID=A0AAV1FE07_XYRNO|nr:CD209 antigen-like protein E [Xyrichtys novacula]
MESTGTNDDIYGNFEMEEVDKNRATQRRNKLPPKCGTVCVGLLLALLVVGNIGQLVYHAVSSTDREYYNNQREELQRNYEAKLGNLSDEVQTTHLIREAKARELTQQVRDIVTMIAKGKNCDTGWKKYGLSCYFVSTAKKNWAASREDCKAQGADLVVINSEEEKDFVTGLVNGPEDWIGLTDSAQEGSWMWVDGTPVTTTYWSGGQPNSSKGDQDCGEMWKDSKQKKGLWNDEDCSLNNTWICEKKLTFE